MHIQPFLLVNLNSQTLEGTHILDACSAIPVDGSDYAQTLEELTSLTHVQPFSSLDLIAQTLESDSLAGCIFSHS